MNLRKWQIIVFDFSNATIMSLDETDTVDNARFRGSGAWIALDYRMTVWVYKHDKNVAITDALLKEKASAFAREMNLDEFEASDEWVKSFSER